MTFTSKPGTSNPNSILEYVRESVADVTSPAVRRDDYDLILAAVVGDDPESYDLADFAFCDMQTPEAQDHAARVLAKLVAA